MKKDEGKKWMGKKYFKRTKMYHIDMDRCNWSAKIFTLKKRDGDRNICREVEE